MADTVAGHTPTMQYISQCNLDNNVLQIRAFFVLKALILDKKIEEFQKTSSQIMGA